MQESNRVLAHIANEDLNLLYYEVCSQYVAHQVLEQQGEAAEAVLLKVLDDLKRGEFGAGMRCNFFEIYLTRFWLPSGGEVTVATFDQGEQPSLSGAALLSVCSQCLPVRLQAHGKTTSHVTTRERLSTSFSHCVCFCMFVVLPQAISVSTARFLGRAAAA